jgi:LPS export ABC transporter protein LptC
VPVIKLILFFSFLFFNYSCKNDASQVKNFYQENHPIEIIEDAELIHTEFGNIKLKIKAEKIERFVKDNPRLVFSNNIEVIFFDKSSDTISNLKANKAVIDETSKLMEARENVVLVSREGNKLETDHLIWDEKKEKIYTEAKVVITTEREVINAEGFISDPNFVEYSLFKVNGVISIEH